MLSFWGQNLWKCKTCPRASLLIGRLHGLTLAEWHMQLCNAAARAVRACDLCPFLLSTNKRRCPMYLQGPLRNFLLQVRKLLWGTWFIWATFSPNLCQGLCPNHDFPAVIFAGSPRPACSLALVWEDVEQACLAHEGGRGDGSCNPPSPLHLPALLGGVQAHPPQLNCCSHTLLGPTREPGPRATPFGKYFSKLLSIAQ